jgi:CubicO group peptidase (beta-lactamase class C family)
MMKKRTVRRIAWLLVVLLVGVITVFVWPRLPIITAFASKGMCSSVFLAHKEPARVMAEDLSFFPISLARSKIDMEEQSVTSTVFGLAKRKAIFREGLGAVIVLDTPEEELKAASFRIPDPGYSQDTIPWPLGDVLPSERAEGIDYDRLQMLIDTSFDRAGEEPFKKTLAIAVVYDNQLVAEKYLEGYDAHTKFHDWSMTKSIMGVLAGILADQGRLKPDAPVNIPGWAGDERANITLENLIHMSSGLDWYENYFTISDATLMLMQSDDMFSYISGCRLAHKPGSTWNYSSGDANLVSGIIRREITDDDAYHAFPYEKLFHRIGMLHTVIETDASGLFVASSYSYGTARDWARFGMLFLNNGVFQGDTILSQEWVTFMKTAAPASDGTYAGTFWLKEPNPANALVDVPGDIFFADGFQGQRTYVIPSKKLVVVRMGYSMRNFSMNDFLKGVIASVGGS